MSEVRQWLDALGLGCYADALEENALEVDQLSSLSDEEFKELGVVAIGHRKRIRDTAILNSRPKTESSIAAVDHSETRNEAERRQLTVMFCDLVGSTALAQRLDPEELREVLSAFREACEATVRKHDGFVARHMGDGLLIYFGYPKASEDDSARAVRAGLDLVAAVGALSPLSGATLSVRVGIATGLVVAGEKVGEGASEELAVLGQAPNLAARLQGIAEPDTVLVAGDTRRLVSEAFELETLPPRQIKGIEEPVTAYRVVRERDEPSPLSTDGTALIGRRSELALLEERWQAARDGEGQVVLLCGEPGVGKSRLSKEFRDRLDLEAHSRILCYAAPHHRSTAFYPIAKQIERVLECESTDSPARKLERLVSTLEDVGVDVEETGQWIAGLLGLSDVAPWPQRDVEPDQRKTFTVAAVQAIVETMATKLPVLFVVEDLHWADPSTLDLLGTLISGLTDCRCLLLLSYRPDFEPPWVAGGRLSTLTLTRLSRRETPKLIAAAAGNTVLPDRVVTQIVERTDGIPLFVEELTKSVVESGDLSIDEIPTSLQDSLTARLDRLGAAKSVAQLAAVVGRSFDRFLVAEVSRLDPISFDAALERMLGSGLVSSLGGHGGTYQFKHALIRDAAYDSLLRTTRRELHQRIAVQLEQQLAFAPGVSSDLFETLAHHARAGELWAQAFQYARESGTRALAASGYRESIEHLEHAIDALHHLERSRERIVEEIDVRMLLRGGYGVVGDLDAMLDVMRRSEALAAEIGDEERQGTISIHLAYILCHRGEIDHGIASGQRAISIGERIGNQRLAAGGRISASHGYLYGGRNSDVVSLLVPTLDFLDETRLERIGSPMTSSVNGFSNLAIASSQLGELQDAENYANAALECARETLRPLDLGYAELAAALAQHARGDAPAAQGHASESLAAWQRGEVHFFIGAAAATLARAHLLANRIEEAGALADQALADCESMGPQYWRSFALDTSALVAMAQSNISVATERGDAALAMARRFGFRGIEASTLRTQGALHLRCARFEEARRLLGDALTLAETLDLRPLAAQCRAELGLESSTGP